jgi:hypothetical protein
MHFLIMKYELAEICRQSGSIRRLHRIDSSLNYQAVVAPGKFDAAQKPAARQLRGRE